MCNRHIRLTSHDGLFLNLLSYSPLIQTQLVYIKVCFWIIQNSISERAQLNLFNLLLCASFLSRRICNPDVFSLEPYPARIDSEKMVKLSTAGNSASYYSIPLNGRLSKTSTFFALCGHFTFVEDWSPRVRVTCWLVGGEAKKGIANWNSQKPRLRFQTISDLLECEIAHQSINACFVDQQLFAIEDSWLHRCSDTHN